VYKTFSFFSLKRHETAACYILKKKEFSSVQQYVLTTDYTDYSQSFQYTYILSRHKIKKWKSLLKFHKRYA